MAKHECPDCGASHEMSAEGRIHRLEERVKELEGRGCSHPHWYWWQGVTSPSPTTYYPSWDNTSTGTWTPDSNVTVYSTSSGNALT